MKRYHQPASRSCGRPLNGLTLGVMIEHCTSVEQPGWLEMRKALWPHCSVEEHLAEMAEHAAEPQRYAQFVAYSASRQPIGFAEASVRTDYVNGTETSPVAFLEGIYVTPEFRRKGIAASLVSAVSSWALTVGCRELASDALLENENSHSAHRALGFQETERVVYFRKALSWAEKMIKPHEANQAFWDASTKWWKEREDRRGLWIKAHEDPSLVLSPAEMPFLKDVDRKEVCVLGSGDNEVAFALVGLGGHVTSVDISERRLDIAVDRARTLGLHLSFLRADVKDLSALEDNAFDLVYTGGHMSVWVSDIRTYYAEAARILKPGALFVVNEYHPIRRMWLGAEGPKPRQRYFNRGPYTYLADEGLSTFEYHWTVADHIQAVVDAGCRIVKVEEYGEKIEDEFWVDANLDKLPAYLMIVGRKDSPNETTGGEV